MDMQSAEQLAHEIYERLKKEMDDHLQAEADRNRHPAEVENDMLRQQLDTARAALEAIVPISDVGVLFDGHDELNEFTHEENAQHMERALDRIYEIVRAALDAHDTAPAIGGTIPMQPGTHTLHLTIRPDKSEDDDDAR